MVMIADELTYKDPEDMANYMNQWYDLCGQGAGGLFVKSKIGEHIDDRVGNNIGVRVSEIVSKYFSSKKPEERAEFLGHLRGALPGVLRNLPKDLQFLDLSQSRRVIDLDLEAVAEGSPSLKVLNIRENLYVTKTGVRSVIKGCPHLQIVNIYGCYVPGDDYALLSQENPSVRIIKE